MRRQRGMLKDANGPLLLQYLMGISVPWSTLAFHKLTFVSII